MQTVRKQEMHMNSIFMRLLLYIMILNATCLCSCDEDEALPTGTSPTGVVTSLIVSPKMIKNGDQIKFHYIVHNYGPDTLSLVFPQIQQVAFNIHVPSGEIIYHPYLGSLALSYLYLLPGNIARYEHLFSTRGINVNTYWPPDLRELPAGQYVVSATLIDYDREIPESESWFRIVK
jgi:hypothetical protein